MNASQLIDKKIEVLGDWRGEGLARIRALIHELDPDVAEDWKWRGVPVWSHDGMYALANAYKDKISLVFFHGAQLADPKKLFNNMLVGSKWRAIDIAEGKWPDEKALRVLLNEAIAYNKKTQVPKSKGSRTAKMRPKRAKSP